MNIERVLAPQKYHCPSAPQNELLSPQPSPLSLPQPPGGHSASVVQRCWTSSQSGARNKPVLPKVQQEKNGCVCVEVTKGQCGATKGAGINAAAKERA